MKRYLIILTLYLCAVVPTMAQYYSVNYDKRTVEAMTAAFATEAATEAYYAEQVAKIRDHYQAAEEAAAGETTVAKDGAYGITSSCRSKINSHGIEVINVFLQILLGEVGTESRKVVKHRFPIHVAQLRQFQDGSQFLVNLQKCYILEREGAVGDDRLELIAESLGLFTYLI